MPPVHHLLFVTLATCGPIRQNSLSYQAKQPRWDQQKSGRSEIRSVGNTETMADTGTVLGCEVKSDGGSTFIRMARAREHLCNTGLPVHSFSAAWGEEGGEAHVGPHAKTALGVLFRARGPLELCYGDRVSEQGVVPGPRIPPGCPGLSAAVEGGRVWGTEYRSGKAVCVGVLGTEWPTRVESRKGGRYSEDRRVWFLSTTHRRSDSDLAGHTGSDTRYEGGREYYTQVYTWYMCHVRGGPVQAPALARFVLSWDSDRQGEPGAP